MLDKTYEPQAVEGRIYPSTASNVALEATLIDGRLIAGETHISRSKVAIDRIHLRPRRVKPIEETLQAIAGARLLLSVRLHGAFVGTTLGVPTIGFEYSPKLRYYFESIGSRSLLGWNELSEDPHCLERAANVALAESATQADASKGVHAARQGVVNFLRAFE